MGGLSFECGAALTLFSLNITRTGIVVIDSSN